MFHRTDDSYTGKILGDIGHVFKKCEKNPRFSFIHLSLIDRLLFLDADGIILKNMDHLLFDDSLLVDYDLAMALGYWFLPIRWLTSTFILVKPSESLYGKVRAYLSSNNFKLLKEKKKGHFDMEIINNVLGGQVTNHVERLCNA